MPTRQAETTVERPPPSCQGVVADAMLHRPKPLGPTAVVDDVRAMFTDDHVLAALVLDGELLLTMIERQDIRDDMPGARLAATLGTLRHRTVGPGTDLASTWAWMRAHDRRRLVVVEAGRCVGLLCLKSSGSGFCSDAGVLARAEERARTTAPTRDSR